MASVLLGAEVWWRGDGISSDQLHCFQGKNMDKRTFFAFVMVWFIVMVIVADNRAKARCDIGIGRKRFASRCKKDERTRKTTEFKEKLRNLQNAR